LKDMIEDKNYKPKGMVDLQEFFNRLEEKSD
jgi:hypothetical protein